MRNSESDKQLSTHTADSFNLSRMLSHLQQLLQCCNNWGQHLLAFAPAWCNSESSNSV